MPYTIEYYIPQCNAVELTFPTLQTVSSISGDFFFFLLKYQYKKKKKENDSSLKRILLHNELCFTFFLNSNPYTVYTAQHSIKEVSIPV